MTFKSTPNKIANYSQVSGTNIRDILTANYLEVLYGGPGDDDLSIANQLRGETVILSGGNDDDTYIMNDQQSALIVDSSSSAASSYDIVKFNSFDSQVRLSVIDDNHLLLTDIFNGTTALIYDAFGYINHGNKIESISFFDSCGLEILQSSKERNYFANIIV